MMLGSLELAVTLRVWASFAAPEVMPDKATFCNEASSVIVRLLSTSKVGGSFTAFTVTVNVRVEMLFDVPPSFTVTVITELPKPLFAGVKVKLPLVPGLT